ncbi:MAG: sugar ABC transporter ATP-binding protein, partial [Mesorhizobium sp.]
STLMRVLEGEHRPDSGRVLVDGQPVQLSSPRAAHGSGIRVIHQEPEIIPELTVAENIFIGDIKARGAIFLDRADLERRSLDLLRTFGVVDVLSPGQRCHGLSPALRQLIEIMRALRPGARLLAFDEPTSSLTEDEAQRLFRVIRRLKADGVAVIYISHRLREIIELADRCVVMRDGSRVADEPIAALDEQRMVRLMVGRPVSDLFNRKVRALGPVRLALEGVTTRRVDGISFEVRAGEIVGLGGLVGAGRTEVARAVVGLDPLLSGRMAVGGRPYRQARGPAVLILDEPTRGIDVGAKAEIYRLIESLADQGLAILLISSEMPELLGLADRVLVMQSGRISGELPWQEASEEAVLALAMRSDKKAIERRVS